MKSFIVLSTILNVIFLMLHELDACFQHEWKMIKFLQVFKERTQYLIFLYFHIPLFMFFIYYLWVVNHSQYFSLWIIINILSVLHLIIHLFALKWRSNVFQTFTSFFFIGGAAATGLLNLLLYNYY